MPRRFGAEAIRSNSYEVRIALYAYGVRRNDDLRLCGVYSASRQHQSPIRVSPTVIFCYNSVPAPPSWGPCTIT